MSPLCCCCYCFILLLSWNCHCAHATTDESQQQHYTVTTIIKQLMITKILNNICRFIWILLLLWGLSYVIWKDHLWSKAWNVNEFRFSRGSYFGQWNPLVNQAWISKTITPNNFHNRLNPTPPPIDHRSMEDHYTASVAWQTYPIPPPINHISMEDHYTT